MAKHQSSGGADVDALIAEVEAAQSAPKAAGAATPVAALPPGLEDLAMTIFIFLLNWWKSRTP